MRKNDKHTKELNKKLKEKEEEISEQDSFNGLPPKDIFSFLESRSGADLLRLVEENDLNVSPPFQRPDVWSVVTKTRFIDSLTKDLPIPSMCFSYEISSEKYEVVDGKQRVGTIVEFLKKNSDWKKLSYLEDVRAELSGKSLENVKEKYNILVQKIKNVTLPITVVRYDAKKKEHLDYVFTIFHRLNTGGMKLNSQEIRNCIFQGSFNDFLKELVYKNNSKKVFGENKRFSAEEQVLRFFCFNDRWEDYKGAFSKFLNEYMDYKRKKFDKKELTEKNKLFNDVVKVAVLISNFKKESKAVKDAVLVGIAKNIEELAGIANVKKFVRDAFEKLKKEDIFSVEKLISSLDSKTKTLQRFTVAIKIFKP